MPTPVTTIDGFMSNATISYYASPSNHNATDVAVSGNVSHSHSGNVSYYNDTMDALEETNPRLVNGVVVLLLLLFNLGGNGLVLYVYHSLFKNTVFCLFVKALASLDLLTALTTMLIDVLMKMRHNHETMLNTDVMCKMSHFQVYATSLASGCVLILIAHQRYTKICRPLERGMQLKRAKILLAIISVVCLVVSIPTIILYGPRHVKVLVRSTVVHATICRADENYKDSPMNLIFYYALIIAFSLVIGTTFFLYCLVSRSIRKFEKRSSFLSVTPITPTAVSATANEEYGNGSRQHDSPHTARTLLTSPVHGRPVKDPFQNQQHPVQTPVANDSKRGSAKKKERYSQARMSTFSIATSGHMISAQMYKVFSIITIVYIFSYLPHLLALILTKVLKLDDKELTYLQRMVLEFAYNCPYISTVSNPLIYGFSSSEFRDRVRDLLQSWDCCGCCCCCCCCSECCEDD